MPYEDDPDQLPELPDPGPRDGRHGVDRDREFDPYPARRGGTVSPGAPLHVSIEDVGWHLALLIDRAESGDEIVITRHGHPVARLLPAAAQGDAAAAAEVDLEVNTVTVTGARVLNEETDAVVTVTRTTVERTRVSTAPTVYNDEDQLPELPDPGPRDGHHGVDRENGIVAR